jgi:hypothetical protein
MTPDALRADPWAFGRYCLVVGEVHRLADDLLFPCRGMLGRWPLPPAAIALLRALTGHTIRAGFTLQQPYASAIIAGPKRIENRPQAWDVPPEGIWVGLHAGKELYRGKDNTRGLLKMWRREGGFVGLPGVDPEWLDAPQLEDLPRGVILGAMRIDACLAYPVEVSRG